MALSPFRRGGGFWDPLSEVNRMFEDMFGGLLRRPQRQLEGVTEWVPAFLVGTGPGYLVGGPRRVRRALQYTTPANTKSRRTTPPISNACARGPANSGVPLVILSAALVVVAVSKKLLRLLSEALWWASRPHSSPHHASATPGATTGLGS